jgi:hypothetical protein
MTCTPESSYGALVSYVRMDDRVCESFQLIPESGRLGSVTSRFGGGSWRIWSRELQAK